jgi:hypothetical protein
MLHVRKTMRFVVSVTVSMLLAPGLLAQTPGAEDDIRGPRELVEIPVPEKPPVALWVGIGGGLLVLVIAFLIWKKLSSRRMRKSPPEVAMGALSELAATRETLPAETFANRAAFTVRQFISDQFGLAAPKRTTEEFLHDLSAQSSPIAGESDHLRVFLKACDLAKFAGSHLNAAQRDELLDAARSFIAATSKPVQGGKTA